jgi:1,4-alpha-glucan branching enzyme
MPREAGMPKGYLAFVLHAHLPFVRHPEYDAFLEERWFFEAMTETYVPLVKFLDRLAKENMRFQITISLSPSLLAMMEDPLLQKRYDTHLSGLIELSEKEMERTRYEPQFHELANMYHGLFQEAREIFVNQCGRRISSAFRRHHELGIVELITTSSTHAILPLIASQKKAVAAQVINGLDYFESVFGFRPQGMWLPECGYSQNVEAILKEARVRYFIMESHGLEHASSSPLHGVYAPLYTPSGIAAFGRDRGSTKQVWSAREGYPGNPDYREFYRDIGHDLAFEYVHPYIAGDVRVDTGIKYHRITGPSAWKEPYRPDAARERAAHHAGDFLHKRIAHIEYLASAMETAPVVLAPFDAELFGHWWFEGPQWLDFIIRKALYDQDVLELTSLSSYLDRHPVHQTGVPSASTWGHKVYFQTWMNEKTDWIYPQLYECTNRMERLAAQYRRGRVSAVKRRALNQCFRELLLAQSSDWPFIIDQGTSVEYAERRVKDHVARFHYLSRAIETNSVKEEYLAALEHMDNIFPDIDYKLFV